MVTHCTSKDTQAQTIRLKGDALRANPDVIHMTAVEKWNGQLPMYTGNGTVPLIQLPQAK